jgi:serine/threonine-protein kinase
MTDRLQPETVVDARYRIEHRLGSGGMADVYCATDLQLGRRVALKLLYRRYAEDSEFVERFRREASAAAGLQHRHVVSVYDRGAWDGTYYIAMEYLDGRSLKALIHQEAPLEPDRAGDLAIQILSAARFAHQRGIIHRDLKPQNVIVDADGQATVTDFGIARSGASDMTQTGSIMGTAQYLSPEQAQGHAVGAQSDLYSIGIILYEMLTGRVPFEGESAVAIALKQVGEQPLPPSALNPAVTPALEQVVMRALAKDPGARYADAGEFIAALEAARAGIAHDAGPPTEATMIGVPPVVPVEPSPPRYAPPPPPTDDDGPSRGWWWFALAALLVVGVLIAALLLLRKDQVTVPAVVGSDVAAARAALQNDGFEVDAVQATATQKSGTVIGQNPEGGTKADEGSTVVLTVSSGPGQAQVPSVDGLSEAAARRKLLDTGFEVKTRKKSSDDVPEGDAIGTEPSAGSQVDKGGTVTLIVSTGKQEVEVPNVVGAKRDAAESTLQDAGFTVDINEQEDDSKPENTVLSQDPAAGEKLPKGSRVTIVVATAPEQVDVPDTVGDDENGAIEELSGAGFKVRRTVVAVDSEDEDGIVQTQDPAGGEKAEKGETVTIGVGSFTPPAEPTPGTEGGTAPTP